MIVSFQTWSLLEQNGFDLSHFSHSTIKSFSIKRRNVGAAIGCWTFFTPLVTGIFCPWNGHILMNVFNNNFWIFCNFPSSLKNSTVHL